MELISFNQRGLLPPWAFQQKLGITITEKLRKLLFGSGQQGAFYVPKPTVDGQQVLFQDSAGTTPVMADGQPVGLMLDLSKELKLGPEGISSPLTGSLGTGSTFSGDCLVLDPEIDLHGQTSVSLGFSPVLGKTYLVSMEVSEIVGGGSFFRLGSTSGDLYRQQSNGKYEFRVKPAGTDPIIRIGSHDISTDTFTMCNISVRELPGNHATQEASIKKPLYRTDGTLHWLEFDGASDIIETVYSTLLAQPAILSSGFTFKGASADVLFGGATTTNRHQISTDGSSNLIMATPSEYFGFGVTTPYPKSVITGFFNGASSQARTDGVSVAGNVGTGSADGLYIGGLTGDSNYTPSDVYGVIHVENDGSDLGDIEEYLADLSGVTL